MSFIQNDFCSLLLEEKGYGGNILGYPKAYVGDI